MGWNEVAEFCEVKDYVMIVPEIGRLYEIFRQLPNVVYLNKRKHAGVRITHSESGHESQRHDAPLGSESRISRFDVALLLYPPPKRIDSPYVIWGFWECFQDAIFHQRTAIILYSLMLSNECGW